MGATDMWTKVWPLRPLSSLHSPSRGGEEERPFGNQRCQVCNSVNLAKCVFMKTQCVFVKTQCVFKSVFIFPINLRTARKYFGKATYLRTIFQIRRFLCLPDHLSSYPALSQRECRHPLASGGIGVGESVCYLCLDGGSEAGQQLALMRVLLLQRVT